MIKPFSQKPIHFVLIPVCILIITGCGGDKSSNTSDTSTPDQPQPDNIIGNCQLTPTEVELLKAHNQARATARQCGNDSFAATAPLSWHCTLGASSLRHSKDMSTVDFFSHTGSDGSSPFDRISEQGYDYRQAGENIAGGQKSVEQVMSGWLESPGHCRNIMAHDFTQMGASKIDSPAPQNTMFSTYWTVNFGTPR